MSRLFDMVVVAGLFVAQAALAQDGCESFVGRIAIAEDFDVVTASLSGIASRGEFETSAQYNARVAASGARAVRIVSKEVNDRRLLRYDADNDRLRVAWGVFLGAGMDYWGAFIAASRGDIGADRLSASNIAVVVTQSDVPSGSYEARNSFGATASVQQVTRTTAAIFERRASFGTAGSETLFRSSPDAEVGQLPDVPMTASRVQELRAQLRIAFVVEPRPPFLIVGQQKAARPTFSNPVEITEDFRILLADIQCALLMDGSGSVLASYTTN